MMLIWKRLLRKPALCVMFALLFACILLCGTLTGDDGIPACGIVIGSDPIAKALGDRLTADGLIAYESETALRTAVARGEIAMGAILPDDLTARLEKGRTGGMIAFIESPTAMLRPLYRYRIAAYLLEAYTPYLTSELLADAGVARSPDEMRAEIDAYLAKEAPFAFTFADTEGAAANAQPYSLQLCAGVVALFLFFAFGLFACPYTEKQLASVAKRVGAPRALCAFALPSIAAVLTLFAAVVTAALCLTDILFANGAAALIPAALGYAVFLSAIGVLCTAIFGDAERLRVPMIALCLLSLGFCPIFADLPALIGVPAWPRLLLPPSFFYAAIEAPIPCAIDALALFGVATSAYAGVICKKQR